MSGGFYIGLFAVLFLAIVIWSSMKRAGKKQHYDEMQLKIRADGYRLGYFVTIALLLVLLMVLDSNLITFGTPACIAYGSRLESDNVCFTFICHLRCYDDRHRDDCRILHFQRCLFPDWPERNLLHRSLCIYRTVKYRHGYPSDFGRITL